MPRNAAAVPAGPRRGPQWSRLRNLESTSGSERHSLSDPPRSPRSASTNSTAKDTYSHHKERSCSVAVIDYYPKDEVLLNFDRLGGDARQGSLMAITAIKGDASKASGAYGSLGRGSSEYNGGRRKDVSFSLLDQDYISSRYVFIAKDMPKEMKNRYPDADITVTKHIADAFGMKKGVPVMLAHVSLAARVHSSLLRSSY